jgi:hypothetical protein
MGGGAISGAGRGGDPAGVTGATKRYPTRCTVAIYCGCWAASPSTRRSSRMQEVSTPALTTVSGHPWSSSASLVTTCPACSTSAHSTASALGGTATTWVPHHSGPCGPARRYAPKHRAGSCGMASPLATRSVVRATSEKHQRNIRETTELRQDFCAVPMHSYRIDGQDRQDPIVLQRRQRCRHRQRWRPRCRPTGPL